jgi:arylsulfatase
MNLQKFMLGIGVVTVTCAQLNTLSAQAKPKIKPNVIIIVADDLGYMDVQCYGADKVKTPNIDRLAKEGMKFNNFYSMPSSSPSYAALFTGCYPKRVGITSDLGPKGTESTEKVYNIGLNPKEMTLAKMVKQNNYATCLVGKWHLGNDTTFLPTKQGFDEFFGIPYASDMCKAVNNQWGDLPLLDGTKVIEENPDQSQLTKRYTERAIDFITRNSKSQFLLCMALTNTHVPLAISKDFTGKSKGGPFYDAVEETDWAVGQIAKTIQKLDIDKQTIIIFTSDNGPNILYGNYAGYAGGLKEGVNTIFEGGVRVPFIFRYPDRAPGGLVTNEFGSIIDILPTIADLTRCTLPTTKIDGVDLWPVLSNMEKLLRARKAYYYYLGDQLLGIRQGSWKFYMPHSYPSVTDPGKNGKPGKIRMMQTEMALYNLDEDPSETNNVYGDNRELVKRLQSMIEAYDKEMEQNKRPAGKVDR